MLKRRSLEEAGDRYFSTLSPIDLGSCADFRIGGMEVQPSTLQVVSGGSARTIEPRVMQALVALSRADGAVVSRDQLVDLCWAGRIVGEDAINRCISKVRSIGIESQAFEIDTIPRVGYRLRARGAGAAEGAARTRHLRSTAAILAALLIVGLLAGAFWYARSSSEPPQPKIAVLPFSALNNDPEIRNLGASVAGTISNALVQTGAELPDGVASVGDARKAGASLVVSGTIRRDGSTLRITTRVISVRDGSTISSNEASAPSDQAPALAGAVAAWLIPPVRMWASFLPAERDAATNDRILQVFLTFSGDDPLRSWELSRRLAAAKPDSGAAQLVFALMTSNALPDLAPEQRAAAVASARSAAASAARLLPDPGRPLAVLDCHLTAPGWQVLTPGCDRRARAALAGKPDLPLLPFLFGVQLEQSGRFAEAAKMVDLDLAQNPLGPGQLRLRIFIARMMDSPDAEAALPVLQARVRRYLGAGATADFDYGAAVAKGDLRSAEALLADPAFGPWIAGADTSAVLRPILRAVNSRAPGDIAAVRGRCAPAAFDRSPSDAIFATCLVALNMVGDLDGVFALADHGYRDIACCTLAQQEQQWLTTGGVYYSRWELFGKAMATARADPRFVELARRTGLLAYWKAGHPPDFCSFERAPVCALIAGTTTAR